MNDIIGLVFRSSALRLGLFPLHLGTALLINPILANTLFACYKLLRTAGFSSLF